MEKHTKILILIFIIALSFRLFFAFQTPNLDYSGYFNYIQIDHISKTGFPLMHDPLSQGGRTFIFSPVFHYIFAGLILLLPDILVLKIIPNIFASSLIFIVFLISKKLTKDINVSLLTSFVSAFIPIFFAETVNSLSIYSLILPLIFLMVYLFLDINKKKNIILFIILLLILTFLHPSSFLLIFGLLVYLLITKLENIRQSRAEIELVLFSTFFVLWAQFLIYKNAFLSHGPLMIWQNLPLGMLSKFFIQINITNALINIGFIPLIYGVYTTYKYAFREKDKDMYLIISLVLSASILLWLKLLELKIGLSFLGILLVLLFAKFYKSNIVSIKKSKFSRYTKQLFALFIVLFIITSVIPSYTAAKDKIISSPSKEETEALLWLKENSDKDSTILGSVNQGFFIENFAERKTVIDSNFLLTKNPSQKYYDVERIYKTQYKTEAVNLLNKYNIDYIFISKNTLNEFNIKEVRYISDEECFIPIFVKDVKIYKSVCIIETK